MSHATKSGFNTPTRGFTLLEFLLSLSIGLGLISLLFVFHIHLKHKSQWIQALGELQEASQIAFSWLSRDAHRMGFIGCPRLAETHLHHPHWTAKTSLQAWQSGSSLVNPSLPLPTRARKDSDAILFRFADPIGVPVIQAKGKTIQLQENTDFVAGELVLISDCENAELFRWQSDKLRAAYQEDAQVRRLHEVLYYVGETDRKNLTGKKIYALYRQNRHPKLYSIPLVDGIERLSLRYGIKNGNNIINYVTAAQVTDWEQVKSVEVTLELASLENVKAHPIQRLVHDNRTTRPDLRLKQTWRQVLQLKARTHQ
jgi:type IV pilus assembly protein PilW